MTIEDTEVRPAQEVEATDETDAVTDEVTEAAPDTGTDTDAETDAGEIEAIDIGVGDIDVGDIDADDLAEPELPELGAPSLRAAIEAILLVVDTPIDATMMAQVCARPQAEVEECLRELAQEYAEEGRGIALREVAGGWRFYTREECAGVVERFVRDGQAAKLTNAALETLAVVAYRQPVSRSRVSAVRGVNVDGVMKTLLARGLVEEAGTEQESGATLYRTTSYFLERLGLRSIDELPELAPFLPDLSSLEGDIDMPSN